MANIVELREMSDDKLQEMLENAREEMFNLRFQNASARLDDYSRLKAVRREIAQLETVLNNRRQAVEAAANEPEIATLLADQSWQASTHFHYEDSAWQVEFQDDEGNELARATVNLNAKRPHARKARAQSRRNKKLQPRLVTGYEITG
jgi:large subunit ribosomal protein L29